MKKRILLALLAAVMTTIMLVTSVSALSVDSFTDKNDFPNWCKDEIAYVVENGLMKGVSDNEFDYAKTLTRAEMAVMLYRLETAVYGEPEAAADSNFPDISGVKSWAGEAINWAAAEGIVKGSDGKFNPNGLISNAEMATMLYRYIQSKPGLEDLVDITRVEDITPVEEFNEAFNGEWKKSDYFYDAAYFVGEVGLMIGSDNKDNPGYNYFNTAATSMRGQAANVLARLHKFLVIPTLEAEIIMENWSAEYQTCAHPDTVYMMYARRGYSNYNSSELNQSVISAKNLQAMFEASFDCMDYDPAEWEVVIKDLDILYEAFHGGVSDYNPNGVYFEGGHVVPGVTVSLVSVDDPSVSVSTTMNLALRQTSLDYYPLTSNYNTKTLSLLPSRFVCHELTPNYTEEMQANLEAMFEQYLAAVKHSDGAIHIAIDSDVLETYDELSGNDNDGYWYIEPTFSGAILRALYYSWENTGLVEGGSIMVPMILGFREGDDYEPDPLWTDTFTEDDLKKDQNGNIILDDPNDPESFIVLDRTQGAKVHELFDALKAGNTYTTNLPLSFRYAALVNEKDDPSADQEVKFVFEVSDTVSTHQGTYATVVTPATETATVDALGDFYCAECGQMNVVMPSGWVWAKYDYSHLNGGTNFTSFDEFFLYQLKAHAMAHMDISKWSIVGIDIEDTFADLLDEGDSSFANGKTVSGSITFKIGKAADPDAAITKITVPISVTAAQNAKDDVTNALGDANKFYQIFGKCKHTDETADSAYFLQSIIDEYYCELHGVIHVNTHDAGSVNNSTIQTQIKSLFTDYHNGDNWTGRYQEGLLTLQSIQSISGGSAITVNNGVGRGDYLIALDGFYDTMDYVIVPVEISCNTAVPVTGICKALTELTDTTTGETKSLCVNTTEYIEWLAEVKKNNAAALDAAIAEFNSHDVNKDGFVTFYYNANNVNWNWSDMASYQIFGSILGTNDTWQPMVTYRRDDGTAQYDPEKFPHGYGFNDPTKDGTVMCDNKEIEIAFTNKTNNLVEVRTIKIKAIASFTMDGTSFDQPITMAQFYQNAKDAIAAASQKFNANGTVTIYYNTDKAASYDSIAHLITAWISDITKDSGNYLTNQFMAARFPKYNDSWETSEDVAEWVDIENGAKACENKAVTIEYVLPTPNTEMPEAYQCDVTITLIKDTGLAMDTSSLTPSGN